MGWLFIYKKESLAFMKGWFKISVICFGLNAVLWHGYIFRIISVYCHFWFEYGERLHKICLSLSPLSDY